MTFYVSSPELTDYEDLVLQRAEEVSTWSTNRLVGTIVDLERFLLRFEAAVVAAEKSPHFDNQDAINLTMSRIEGRLDDLHHWCEVRREQED